MAGVKMPLMSLDATDSIGKAITFSKWKGRHYVRTLVKPKNPKSGLQTGVRASFRWNAQQFGTIGATPTANWKAAAKTSNITPLNAMQRTNQQRARQDKPPLKDPLVVTLTAEAAPAAPLATAQPVSLKLTWTDSVSALDWGTAIYMSATGIVTTGPATLLRMVKKGDQVYIVPKLKTGTVYHFKLRGFSTDGTFSADTADFTGTPT